MYTLLVTVFMFVNFVHPVNNGQQRQQAQPVSAVTQQEQEQQDESTPACIPADSVSGMPQLSDYMDGDTPEDIAYQDYLDDLQWWYDEFNVCQ